MKRESKLQEISSNFRAKANIKCWDEEVIRLKSEKKKGILSAIKESLTKTGGCCGPGETCGGSAKEKDKATVKSAKERDKTEKK